MHWAPRVAVSISARREAGELLAGKYAKKFGLCQWVIPGRMTLWKSAKIFSNGSPWAGA
jgi:hypothetical protein